MSEISDSFRAGRFAKLRDILARRRGLLKDYLSAISGSGGRLVFSLLYFVALANALSIADFGLFATASAAGVMLSRILAFGFVSQLYRIATVRPRLIGVFTAGFLLLSLLSLPFLAAASWAAFALFFAGTMPAGAFATVIVAEALLVAPERAGDDRQQRHGAIWPRGDAGHHQLGDTRRGGRHLHRHAGKRPRRLDIALSRRQRSLAGRRHPVLLSAPGAGAEGRDLFQAAARRALCGRRRSAVLPADGAGQAAGAGDRRRRSSPASTPSSCGWST